MLAGLRLTTRTNMVDSLVPAELLMISAFYTRDMDAAKGSYLGKPPLVYVSLFFFCVTQALLLA